MTDFSDNLSIRASAKSPVKDLVKREAALLALRYACRSVPYPHKVLAFLFAKVILGKTRNDGTVQGCPQDVIDKYAKICFDGPSGEIEDSLFQIYKREFARQSGISDKAVLSEFTRYLMPLGQRLYVTVGENVQQDDRVKKILVDILHEATALTNLNDYLRRYEGDDAGLIAEWCKEIKQAVLKNIQQ